MVSNANGNRFIAFNDLPLVCTKYKAYNSPGFHNWAEHNLTEFHQQDICTLNDNIHNQTYEPNHYLVEKDLSVGIPNFNRYISKE